MAAQFAPLLPSDKETMMRCPSLLTSGNDCRFVV
nr:MAG TPA: hypothetical protein [Bacteriophage sp.]